MPESQTAFPIPPYIPQFDGIRAVSILAVFVAHSEFMRALPHASFLEYGRVGVDLFFVLSGFLITGILLDSKSSPNYFRNFYARRALRIWPLYYLLLALIFSRPAGVQFLDEKRRASYMALLQRLCPKSIYPPPYSFRAGTHVVSCHRRAVLYFVARIGRAVAQA